MSGIIVTTPPTVELPPGSTSGSPTLPPITYQYAVIGLPQTWIGKQTFPAGTISLNASDIIGLAASASVDTTNASNITSGTLPHAQLPALSSSDVGLGNVNNTSDVNKPVSTAQAAAIAAVGSVTTGVSGQFAYYASNGKALSGSTNVSYGTFPLGTAVGFYVTPIPASNIRNGVLISGGTGPNGEGGSVTFYRQNGTTASPTTILNGQELGFVQQYAYDGTSIAPPGNPTAVVFSATEDWNTGAHGSGILFQSTPNGTVNATNEACLNSGMTVFATFKLCQPGFGVGTLNAEAGIYDTGKRVLSASNQTMTLNQNSDAGLQISNNSTGTGAISYFQASNSNSNALFGVGGSGYTGAVAGVQNRAFVMSGATLDGLTIGALGVDPIDFYINGSRVGGFAATGAFDAKGTATNGNAGAGVIGEYIDTSKGVGSANATVTMTIAAPCVVTWAAHGFTVGSVTTAVKFTTTGALPTGITSGTTYYLKAIDANTFNIATTADNALAGTFITTTGSQSGTHTADIRVSMTTITNQNVAAISLAAGDYELSGQMLKGAGATTTVTYLLGSISTTSATVDRTFGRTLSFQYGGLVLGNNEFTVFDFAAVRLSLATTTTIYLVALDSFGTSTMICSGWLRARRVR